MQALSLSVNDGIGESSCKGLNRKKLGDLIFEAEESGLGNR